MIQLTNLTNSSNQQTTVNLPDGTQMILSLKYSGGVQRWFYGISHPSLARTFQGLCVHPNLLRPYRNIIDFGLSCVASDGVDPVTVEDFLNQRVAIFILNAADVAFVESQIYGVTVS